MQTNMKKAAATVCLGAVVLTSVPAVAMAATAVEPINQQSSQITPYWMCILSSYCDLSITSRIATADCQVLGLSATATKAKVVAELQQKNGSSWTTIATWTSEKNSYKASVTESKTVTGGKTYRVKATVTVWEGSKSETQTLYSDEEQA